MVLRKCLLLRKRVDLNLGFETFLGLFDKTLDKHAPFKTFTKKKQKQNMKPWVTSGIQRSLKMRDEIYKQMVKSKTKQNETAKFEAYRKYHNKILDLLKISRQSYYQFFFEQNKSNSKILWQGINNIIYSKKNEKSISPSS